MSHLKSTLLAITAATVVAGGVLAPATALGAVTQQFHAVSGDNCRYGQTDGTLDWWTSGTGAVGVTGVLIDRPIATDPIAICPDDRRYSFATFTAYAGRIEVDTDQRRVDNSRLEFRFALGENATTTRIDRVVVQVCRGSLVSPTPAPIYCGPAQSYTPISTTP